MELLTLGVQAVALLWAAAMAWLGIRTMRRALEARRARIEYWRRLLRSSRDAMAHLPPLPPPPTVRVPHPTDCPCLVCRELADVHHAAMCHDGPDDHYLADPDGGGAWIRHE